MITKVDERFFLYQISPIRSSASVEVCRCRVELFLFCDRAVVALHPQSRHHVQDLGRAAAGVSGVLSNTPAMLFSATALGEFICFFTSAFHLGKTFINCKSFIGRFSGYIFECYAGNKAMYIL